MKTIKIIDLLNKIANGEEVPKKIKWEDTIYAYSDYDKDYLEYPFSDEEYRGLFDMRDSTLTQYLNDKVEIIEEKKLPEKINVKGSYNSNKGYEDFNDNEKILVDKINDLLDYLESKEKGE